MENIFNISGFTCGACANLAQKRIEKIDGVNKAEVNLIGEAVILSDREITKEEVQKALEDTQYTVA